MIGPKTMLNDHIVSLDLGTAIFRHPVGTDVRNAYEPDENYSGTVNGGTVNGSFSLYGALLGYYRNGVSSVGILAWQPGFAAEASVSQIQVN